MLFKELRADLAAALRWAARERLHEGVDNHFSVAVPDDDGRVRGDRFLINPYRLHWSEVTASDMVLCAQDGTVLEGKHPVEETAFFIHSRVHRAKPAAVAVLHTHQPHATALTLLEGGRLEMAGQNALMFDGRVAYEEGFNGLALDGDEGERLAAALGDKDVLMMAGHGVLATGPNLAMAFNDLYYLERACMFQILARSHGGTLREIPQEVREKMADQVREDLPKVARGHFAAIKRVLTREAPDYAQ